MDSFAVSENKHKTIYYSKFPRLQYYQSIHWRDAVMAHAQAGHGASGRPAAPVEHETKRKKPFFRALVRHSATPNSRSLTGVSLCWGYGPHPKYSPQHLATPGLYAASSLPSTSPPPPSSARASASARLGCSARLLGCSAARLGRLAPWLAASLTRASGERRRASRPKYCRHRRAKYARRWRQSSTHVARVHGLRRDLHHRRRLRCAAPPDLESRPSGCATCTM